MSKPQTPPDLTRSCESLGILAGKNDFFLIMSSRIENEFSFFLTIRRNTPAVFFAYVVYYLS